MHAARALLPLRRCRYNRTLAHALERSFLTRTHTWISNRERARSFKSLWPLPAVQNRNSRKSLIRQEMQSIFTVSIFLLLHTGNFCRPVGKSGLTSVLNWAILYGMSNTNGTNGATATTSSNTGLIGRALSYMLESPRPTPRLTGRDAARLARKYGTKVAVAYIIAAGAV